MDPRTAWLVLIVQSGVVALCLWRLLGNSRYRRCLAALVLVNVPLVYLAGVAQQRPGEPTAAEIRQFLADYREAEKQAGPMTSSASWPGKHLDSNGKVVAKWQTLQLPTAQR